MGPISTAGVYDYRKLKVANNAARDRAQNEPPGNLVIMSCGRVVEPSPGKVPKAPRNERNQWTLRVLVIAEGGGWPDGSVTVDIRNSGNPYANNLANFNSVRSNTIARVGNGRKLLQISTTNAPAGWTSANQSLTIDDGDDKLVVLRIQRKAWVAFRIYNTKARDYVPGIQMNLTIPNLGAQNVPSLQMRPRLFEDLDLPLNPDTAAIVSLGAQDNTQVWVAALDVRSED